MKAFTVQKGTYSPTDVILGTFQVIKPGTSTRKVMASVSKHDFVGKYILSDSRTLTPQEELTVPQLPDWYIIPPEIKRICEHAKLTTNTVSPMRNFLLRGPAGTGKTELAKMQHGEKVQCYGYYTDVSGVKWLYVVYKGITGFCSSKYLKKK